MTNEEAIKGLKSLVEVRRKHSDMQTMKDEIECLDMAIKELEKASALDKARAEIAEYGSIWVEYCIPGHTDYDIEKIVENVLKQAKEQVLAVIDKYRESENK